jgi:hypothetical protein
VLRLKTECFDILDDFFNASKDCKLAFEWVFSEEYFKNTIVTDVGCFG